MIRPLSVRSNPGHFLKKRRSFNSFATHAWRNSKSRKDSFRGPAPARNPEKAFFKTIIEQLAPQLDRQHRLYIQSDRIMGKRVIFAYGRPKIFGVKGRYWLTSPTQAVVDKLSDLINKCLLDLEERSPFSRQDLKGDISIQGFMSLVSAEIKPLPKSFFRIFRSIPGPLAGIKIQGFAVCISIGEMGIPYERLFQRINRYAQEQVKVTLTKSE